MKYAERRIISICIDVYKVYDGNDNEKLCVCLTRVKIRKLNIKSELVGKYKNMDKDFEHNYSGTAKGIYGIGHNSIRLMKGIAFRCKYFGTINFFNLMASLLCALNEMSQQ